MIVRCSEHPLTRTVLTYTAVAKPLGHKLGVVLCGRPNCGRPGVVWLTCDEVDAHHSGIRVFAPDRSIALSVRVEDELLPVPAVASA